MHIGIYGVGGIGGFFGGHLAAGGHQVTFIARGSQLAALQTEGLHIESSVAPLHLPKITATDDPAALKEADIVLLCTKLWDVESAAKALQTVLKADAVVLPLQNGIESPVILTRILGAERTLGGVAYIFSTIKAPGVISHSGIRALMRLGTFPGGPTQKATAFVALCHATPNINVELMADIRKALWEKFIYLCALSGLTCLSRQSIGVIRDDPDLRATMLASLTETWQLGCAQGVSLSADFVAEQMLAIDKLDPGMRASMLHDLTHGNKLEAPWLCGAVARMANEMGQKAPINATIYAALKPYIGGQ